MPPCDLENPDDLRVLVAEQAEILCCLVGWLQASYIYPDNVRVRSAEGVAERAARLLGAIPELADPGWVWDRIGDPGDPRRLVPKDGPSIRIHCGPINAAEADDALRASLSAEPADPVDGSGFAWPPPESGSIRRDDALKEDRWPTN